MRRSKKLRYFEVHHKGRFVFYARSVSARRLKATLVWKRGWLVGDISVREQ